MRRIVIIGGMAAGCKAAARLKRIMPECEATIIEKQSFVSFGTCGTPFFASGEVDSFMDLARTPWGVVRDEAFFREVKDVNVLTETLAESIDAGKREVHCINLKTGKKTTLPYDSLLIGTGAKTLPPPFPCPESENISTFHNPLDAKKFRLLAQTGQIGSALIIGGGFIGCELAEALTSLWGIETTLIEKENRLTPISFDNEISRILEKTLSNNNLALRLGATVEKIETDGEGRPVVSIGGENLRANYVFLCMGVKPSTSLAESIGVKTGAAGGIVVDGKMRTNIPGVWAAGDCVEVKDLISGKPKSFPLGSLANRQGRVAADSIAGRKTQFPGAAGTISMKIFGLISAACGMSENEAKKNAVDYGTVCGAWYDRPDYHPDNKILFGKIVYEKESLRLLGLQLAGRGEVTRYIDAFSIFASRRASARDLLDLEHAYTPTHSSPLNPLNFLGAMIIAQEEEGVVSVAPGAEESTKYSAQVLDLREDAEAEAFPYPGSVGVLSGEYRSRLAEFDKEKPLLIICQKGPRSYEAARVFKAAGFGDVAYLGGGLQLADLILDADE